MTNPIGWCDETWNPMTGCTPVSEACEHCYAARIAHRFNHHHGGEFAPTFHENRLDKPLHWRKPRRVFVCSMSDLFHEAFTDEQIAQVWARMYQEWWHHFLVLTKRPERMRKLVGSKDFIGLAQFAMEAMYDDPEEDMYVQAGPWPPRNVWLGVSAENQARADERIPILLDTPAAVRFVSVEPMLGPVRFFRYEKGDWLRGDWFTGGHGHGCYMMPGGPKLDWVVLGGETGPGARPMQLEWALGVYRQCKAAGVPFWFKQWGRAAPDDLLWRAVNETGDLHDMAYTRDLPGVTP